MSQVTVYEPTIQKTAQKALQYAIRSELAAGLTLTLVDNGKPRAMELLEFIADGLRDDLPIGRVDVYPKGSAARPLGADEARVIAARSHLVITGVGD
jgi:hypothetical protein